MNTGSALARFTITLSQAVTEPVQVEWFTSDGTAKAGVDYAANKGTVTFAPGETSKTVDILVYGRAVGSEDRTFFVEMLPPTNAILGASIGECIITVDTSGSTPVTAIIVPTGPKGDKGEPGEDGISPDPAEIAVEVAPLIDVGSTTLTAEGTESLSKPDSTTVKAVARRVAYAAAAKIATVTLAAGDNLIAKVDLTGDTVDFNSPGIYPRILRGTSILSPVWSLETDGRLLIKSALAGDLLYVCQYDYVSGEKLNTNVRELWRRVLAEAGYTLVDGSFEKGASVTTSKQAVWHNGGAQCYAWNGALPKTVPADSTPIGTGGISSGAWSSMTAILLRSQLSAIDGFRMIGAIKSLADLATVDTSNLVNGDRLYLEAYHPNSNKLGGRWLYWDTTTNKSAHNGITIFDPTKAFGDWSVRADRTAWYTATGSTPGVFRCNSDVHGITADYAGARPYDATAIDTETGAALIEYLATLGELVDVVCNNGTYRWNISVRGGVRGKGYGTKFTPDDTAVPIITLGYTPALGAGWVWRYIVDIAFDGLTADRSAVTCISYATTADTADNARNGRYVFERLVFSNCNIGIRKPYGNIGNVYRSLSTQNVNYAVWATAKTTAPVMHEGNDTFTKCHFTKCYIACYRTDVTVYGSSLDTVFDQCIMEYNEGFAILQRGSSSNQINVGIIDVRGGHYEGNATAATVMVDGVATPPFTFSFSFTRNVRLQGVLIGSMKLVQASVSASQCQFSDVQGSALTNWDFDQYSVINSTDDLSQYGRPMKGLVVESVLAPHSTARDGFVTPLRRFRNKISVGANIGYAMAFDGAGGIPSASGSLYTSVQQQDSVLGTYSARWTIPASTVVVLTPPASMIMPNGKYYVWTVHARWISGDGTLQVTQAGGAVLSDVLPRNDKQWWTCFGGLGIYGTTGDNRVALRVNGGTTSTVIQTADFQIMTFDRLEEAVAYFNSGTCLYGAP